MYVIEIQFREKVLLAGTREEVEAAVAAQGFGYGIAKEMLNEGASIMVADLNEALAKTVSEEFGEHASYVKVDVSDPASVEGMVIKTVETFGGLDIFVSNAGVAIAGSLDEMVPEKFDFVTKIN